MDTPVSPDTSLERPDVTVVVVNYNTANLLERMLADLEASRGVLKLQIIVVDNASRDNSVQILRSLVPAIELIENPTNIGFGRANNQALALARGRYVLLLNTDAFVSSDTLVKTVGFMDAHSSYGVLGVKLVGPDGSLQPSCRNFPTPWNAFLVSTGLARFFPGARLVDEMSWDHESLRECDWVPGCYYLVRSEVIRKVGLFDPRYFLYFEEIDHCRAVRRAGWSVVYYPFTQVVHLGGASAEKEGQLTRVGRQISKLQIESELLYWRKQYGIAGILASLFLTILGDLMSICSRIVRRRPASGVARTGVMTVLLLKTRLGSVATR